MYNLTTTLYSVGIIAQFVTTLTLGSRPRKKGYKVAGQMGAQESRQKSRKGVGQEEARESHHTLPRV